MIKINFSRKGLLNAAKLEEGCDISCGFIENEMQKSITKEQFKVKLKRIMRQLDERNKAVQNKRRPKQYFQNKVIEFRKLIDQVLRSGWFVMPGKTTRIYRIYHEY